MGEFSKKLYLLRSQSGMSQADFAEKLNVSRQTVSKWELGSSLPEIDKLIAISELFDVSMDYLLKNNETAPVKGNLDRLTLRFLGYAQDIEEISELLVAMMRDGELAAQERKRLKIIMKKMKDVAQVIEEIQVGLTENVSNQ